MKKLIAAVMTDINAWLANSEDRQVEKWLAAHRIQRPGWPTSDEVVINDLTAVVAELTAKVSGLVESNDNLIQSRAALITANERLTRDAAWWKAETFSIAARAQLLRKYVPVTKWAALNDEWNALYGVIDANAWAGPVLSDELRSAIREMGTQAGFTTRVMADGRVDFHEYVYAFAALIMARVAGPGVTTAPPALEPSGEAAGLTDAQELKPCPWCGAVPDVTNDAAFQLTDGSKYGALHCCGTGPEVRTGYESLSGWKQDAIDAWNDRAILAAQPQQAVPEGWQLVPVTPTPKMVDATFNHLPLMGESHNRRNNRIYAAMLAAAPPAPQQAEAPNNLRNAVYMALHYYMTTQNPNEWGAVDAAIAAMRNFIPDAAAMQQAEAHDGLPVDDVHWDLFPSYLIDHCEGGIISEEGLQARLSDMLLSANYKRIAAGRPDAAEVRKQLDEMKAARLAYASEFPLNADGEPDVGSIHGNIRNLKKEIAELRDDAARIEIHLHEMQVNEHYRERKFNEIVKLDSADGLVRFGRIDEVRKAALEDAKGTAVRQVELYAESYESMARQDCTAVHPSHVAIDLRQNVMTQVGSYIEALKKGAA